MLHAGGPGRSPAVALANSMSAMKAKVPAQAFTRAAETLLAYVRNVVAHPDEPKYRRIKAWTFLERALACRSPSARCSLNVLACNHAAHHSSQHGCCRCVQSGNARYCSAIGSQPHGTECMAALGFRPIMEASEEVRITHCSHLSFCLKFVRPHHGGLRRGAHHPLFLPVLLSQICAAALRVRSIMEASKEVMHFAC